MQRDAETPERDQSGARQEGAAQPGADRRAAEPFRADMAAEVRGLGAALRDFGCTLATQQKDSFGDTLQDVADSLSDSSLTLDDRPGVQALFDRTADALGETSQRLKTRSVSDLYGEVERFTRRHPLAVGVGAAALGLLAARFLTSSAASPAAQADISDGGSDRGAADDWKPSKADESTGGGTADSGGPAASGEPGGPR